ncbi:MAG: gallate dioxygenase [Steroidobacteraceae bacterium]
MARIIGGIASSHTPTIGFAFDTGKQDDPAWRPIFEAYQPIRQWLQDKQPDVLLYIYNDHVTSFFFDHYSAFALGVGETYPVADEGAGARDLPALRGDPALARHLGTALMAEEFDMSFFQGKGLDHGCFSPLSIMWDHQSDWPGRVVPLAVGVLQFPIPTAARCYKLGQALRRAIESYPPDIKVALVATGGLSHQVHGERAGFNNTEWDQRFLDLFENDPEALVRMTHADYAKLGGFEGAEVIMWLIMRGALPAQVRKLHQSYYLPSMTGIATAIYEGIASTEPAPQHWDEYLAFCNRQLAGIQSLPGTHPFTLERSVKAYRLSKYLHGLIEPEQRAYFRADEAATYVAAGLTEEEQRLVRERDWLGLIHYGVIFFLLEKLGAVIGVSNPHIYAAFRGETLEQFQKSRNAAVLYSVAGKDSVSDLNWDKEQAAGKK